MRSLIATGLLVAAARLATAQSPAPLSFEVASVKAAAPPTDGRIMVRMGGDAGRINYSNVSMMNIITNAFRVKEHQVSGPGWLTSERFDLTATLPAGASRDQVPEMLQTLLKERFKLACHKESKVLPAYALVAAKGGPKLPPAEPEPEPKAADAGGPPRGGVRMMMGPRGRHMSGKMTIQQLADNLANWLDRPVLNLTEIKGLYDIDLEWSGDEGPQSMRAIRGAGPGPGPGGPGGGDGGPRPESHDESADAPSIFTALQDKLGLKLDPRKAPVDILVIDNAEKAPTEN